MEEGSYNTYKPKKNSRTIILALVLLIIFLLILTLFLYLLRRPALFGSFAQSENFGITPSDTGTITSQDISYDNSYLFASPLKAAVSVERIRITVYILDGRGVGIGGKKVTLGNNSTGLQVYPITDITDSYGRATFDVASGNAGFFSLEASVDGEKLNQTVNVSFN